MYIYTGKAKDRDEPGLCYIRIVQFQFGITVCLLIRNKIIQRYQHT